MPILPDKIKAFNWEHSLVQINAEDRKIVVLRPIEIHLKTDGAKDNTPSFTIVMDNGKTKAIGEFSLKMMNEGLKSIGYELKKIEV